MIGPAVITWGVPSFLALLGAVRYGFGAFAWIEANKLERPKYTVIRKLGRGVEIRRYESYTIAEVTFKKPPTFKNATSNGFRKVAPYIFGANRGKGGKEKMNMTAPVRVELKSSTTSTFDEVKVSFVMGSTRNPKNLPQPEDGSIKLRTVHPHFMAVVAFSGPPPNESIIAQKRKLVEEELVKFTKNKCSGETLVYGYHDPFITPNFLRKNEVGVSMDSI